jgi:hypothetical protein
VREPAVMVGGPADGQRRSVRRGTTEVRIYGRGGPHVYTLRAHGPDGEAYFRYQLYPSGPRKFSARTKRGAT